MGDIHRFLPWCAALGLVPVCAVVAAQDTVSILLEYQAGEGCPDRTAFVAQVRARTNRAQFVEKGESGRTVVVSTRGAGTRTVGSVRLGVGGAPRDVSGDSCADVVTALALITALTIDPRALSTIPTPDAPVSPGGTGSAGMAWSGPSEVHPEAAASVDGRAAFPVSIPQSDPSPPPASLGASATSAASLATASPPGGAPLLPPPSDDLGEDSSSDVEIRRDGRSVRGPARRRARTKMSWGLGARSSLSSGFTRNGITWLGASVWGEIGARPGSSPHEPSLGHSGLSFAPNLRVSVHYATGPWVRPLVGGADFTLAAARFEVLPLRFVMGRVAVVPSLGVEIGALTGVAKPVAPIDRLNGEQHRTWAAVAEGLDVEVTLARVLYLTAVAEIRQPLNRYQFQFDVPSVLVVAEVPQQEFGAGVGAGLRFP